MLCVVGTLVGLSQESRDVREINAESQRIAGRDGWRQDAT